MNTSHLTHYRDLADWSNDDWENLDIHLFIAANFNRYCAITLKRIGIQYLPNDATETLLGIYSDVAYRPLELLHRRYIHVEGERRNQVMLGNLKKIATTRIMQAVINEFPIHISYDTPRNNQDMTTHPSLEDSFDNQLGYNFTLEDHYQQGINAYYAAGDLEKNIAQQQHQHDPNDIKISLMLENLRAHLTPAQYIHLRYTICDGLDPHEIANKTGHSVTNARIMLLNARKTMFNLVPEHLQHQVESCLYRRQSKTHQTNTVSSP